jgi:hypothetical protein
LGNDFNSLNYPYLGDIRFSTSFIDYGLGYYIYKPDMHVNIAFRNYKAISEAFDTDQTYHRTSLGLEVYKFLFDNHGFVPFLGPIVSYDWNRLQVEVGDVVDLDHEEKGLRYGVAFGWDIRQDHIQWLILRTNLRYYPGYNLSIESERFNFNQLEFNFIQAVFYPSRFRWVKKNKPAIW